MNQVRRYSVAIFTMGLIICLLACCPGQAAAQLSAEQQARLQEAQRIMSEADALYQQAKYREVIPKMEQIVGIFRDVYGPRHGETSNALNNLAVAHWKLGHNKQAGELLGQVLEVQQATLPADDFRISATLTNLSNVAERDGDLAAARKFTEQALALELRYRGDNHPQTATALNRMGTLLKMQYRYEEARAYMDRSLAIRRRLFGESHRDTAESLNNIGTLLSDQGDYAGAKPFYEQALAIYAQTLGPRHPHVATLYINMANQMAGMNDWGSARNYYTPALEIYQEVYGAQHFDTAFVLHKIGVTYAHTGDPAEARKYYDRALAIYRATAGEKHTTTAGVLVSLGELQAMERQYDAALPYFEQALAIYQSEESKEPLSAATTLNHLAAMHADLNHFDQARLLYEQNLEDYRRYLGENHPYRASVYDNLGDLYAEQGKWKEAAESVDRGRRIARRHAAKVLPGFSEREQLFYLAKQSVGQLHAGLTRSWQRPDDANLVKLAASWLLNGKGQLQETLAQRSLLARDSRNPQLAETVEQLTQVRQRMAALSFDSASASDEARRELEQLGAQEDVLARQLSQAGGLATADAWVELDTVRAQLASGAVFVDIARFEVYEPEVAVGQSHWKPARYAAWITPSASSAPVMFVDLGDAGKIDAAVAAARKTIEDFETNGQRDEVGAEETAQTALTALGDAVLAPIVARLPADTSRLIISPDANLWLVPWSALPLADGQYAIEQFEFQYVVSGRDLVAPQAAAAKTTAPVIIANPDFDITPRDALAATRAVLRTQFDSGSTLVTRAVSRNGSLSRVERLPGTAAEAAAVAPSLAAYAGAAAQQYTDKYALEGVFKKLSRPKTVVISTHGFFLDDQRAPNEEPEKDSSVATDEGGQTLENPLLRCGLLLAGCNAREEIRGSEDGILTGLEVVGTDLRGTELVVLSACQTGLGRVNTGEGVAGLRQAFQLAGARVVVATLWQIPDSESAQLMSDFFTNLAAGQTKPEALRNAQLNALKLRRAKYSAAHPYYWAAYTLTGN